MNLLNNKTDMIDENFYETEEAQEQIEEILKLI